MNDDDLPLVDENGVDLTSVRESLALTPMERLANNDSIINTLHRIQRLNPGVLPQPDDEVE